MRDGDKGGEALLAELLGEVGNTHGSTANSRQGVVEVTSTGQVKDCRPSERGDRG